MARSSTKEAASTVPSAAASTDFNKGNADSSPGTATPTPPPSGPQGLEPVVRVEVIRQRRLGRSGKLGGETYLYDTEIQLDTASYRANLVPTVDLMDPARFRRAALDRAKVLLPVISPERWERWLKSMDWPSVPTVYGSR